MVLFPSQNGTCAAAVANLELESIWPRKEEPWPLSSGTSGNECTGGQAAPAISRAKCSQVRCEGDTDVRSGYRWLPARALGAPSGRRVRPFDSVCQPSEFESRARFGARKEMPILSALGATRWQVIKQLLLESTLLAAAGGTPGLFLARIGVQGLLALTPANVPRSGEIEVVPLYLHLPSSFHSWRQ
jgi:FtsX-like permease family